MAKLDIPEDYVSVLNKLAKLSNDERSKLLESLKQASPTLQPERLEAQISDELDIDHKDLLEIIKMLGGMYRARISSDISAQAFAEDLNKSLRISDFALFKDKKKRDGFTSFIGEILAMDKPRFTTLSKGTSASGSSSRW